MQATDLGHGRGWLDAPAAASIRRIDRQLGHPVQITEAGRTYEKQDEHYQRYLAYLNGGPWAPIALDPDTPSVHQEGEATDSDEHDAPWEENGWFHTVFRDGVLVERWHREYDTSRDQHINDVADTTPLEDHDMARIISSPAYRAAKQYVYVTPYNAFPIDQVTRAALLPSGIPWCDYPDEDGFNAELRLVYTAAKNVNVSSAKEIVKAFGDRLGAQ